MGTPEDVATEKHFTASGTLTDILRRELNMEPECDADARAIENTIDAIKASIKRWLEDVAIGAETHETLEMRNTLIQLVDEP